MQKINKDDYLKRETYQAAYIRGSGVNLIVLHPFPSDNKMRFGLQRPEQKTLNYYKHYSSVLLRDKFGWYLQWTEKMVKRYYLESLLLHEAGYMVEYLDNKNTSKAATDKSEKFADNYARAWADVINRGDVNLSRLTNTPPPVAPG